MTRGNEAGCVLKYNEQDVVRPLNSSKNWSQLEPALCSLQSATNKLERSADN